MISKFFPFILWFKNYTGNSLKIDFISGLTVALVLIPQSMAYAQLAGLPAYYGLYAAFLPPMVAALFGSSKQLATGPVAVVSLMTAASLEPLATAGSNEFIAYAIMLAFTVGIFQFLLGVLRLGLVVNILSHPVVNGFTNAAAIIIASSQFSKLFGVYVDKAPHHYLTILRVCKSAMLYTHWPTLFIGVLAILIMSGLKRLNPKIPNVLVAVVVTTLISVIFKFENNMTVNVKDIESPEIRMEITNFNKAVFNINEFGKIRSELNNSLNLLKKKGGHSHVSAEEYDIIHEIALAGVEIDQQKHNSHILRKKLREIHLCRVKTSDKKYAFFVKSDLQNDVETDGKVWRIKLGNKPVNTEKIKMTGGGAVVGKIPEGLPSLSIPKFKISVFLQLLPFAVIISLLGFMEAIAIAKAMAAKTGQKLDPNQELIGQGLANILGSIGRSYPVSGSFSRSAVNLQAGALTGVSSVVTSMVVIITLLFLTPLLYHLPQAALAAVIMMAVIGLVNVSGFIHAWKAKRADGLISIITFACTLFYAPHLHYGIMVGVALTMLVFMYKSMRPRVVRLSRSEDDHLRCASRLGLKECSHISIIRFDGPLIFTNATYLEDKVLEVIVNKPDLKHIIIEASGINDLDASGEDALAILIDTVRSSNHEISFCGVKEEIVRVMERTHLLGKIGEENIYPNEYSALANIYDKAHEGTKTEKDGMCPLRVCVLED